MKDKKIKFIPESLRIAGHDIVIETFGKETALAGGLYAAFNAMKSKIIICDELDKISTLDSLIHEVSHAVYHFYGITDEDNEEFTVNQMGVGWAQVWVDNPDLVKFLNYVVKK